MRNCIKGLLGKQWKLTKHSPNLSPTKSPKRRGSWPSTSPANTGVSITFLITRFDVVQTIREPTLQRLTSGAAFL